MKRIITLMLALFLVLSMAACGSGAEKTSDKTAAPVAETKSPVAETEDSVEEPVAPDSILPADLPNYKIVLSYSQFTDTLGGQMKAAMEYLAEDFNIEFVFVESGADSLAAIESALQGDIDGIVMVNATTAILDASKKAGNVPVVMIQSIDRNLLFPTYTL